MVKVFDFKGWDDCYSDYPGVGKITDKAVAKFVIDHTTLFDRMFCPKKMCIAALHAWHMMAGIYDIPDGKWRF